ncbi:EamA family transporter [Nocardia miyunensis]|uniref:EamA family transporter n=1 Tax=Nocardia miyunensis TaxID=282684 RepID=UPI0009FE4E15|nr:EamA family transporter [Nocardia miyunensis]
MSYRDRLLGLAVVLLWGLNFLALHIGVEHLPPLFFAGLRFVVIAVPVIVLVPRPRVPLRWLLLYGLGFGVAQFAFLFTAMRAGMPTGLASLVLQSSAPFTVLLGSLFLRERLRAIQILGLVAAVAGMALIGWDRARYAPVLPVLLTLAGGLGWAFGNIGSRLAAAGGESGRKADPLHLTLWVAVVPPIPLFAMSLLVEGPSSGSRALLASFSGTGWPALAALAYTAILATVVGSGLWTYLMSRYPAGAVAPLSLMVPVVGIASSWLFLGERPTALSLVGGLIVIGGAFAATASGRSRFSASRAVADARTTDETQASRERQLGSEVPVSCDLRAAG